MNPIKSLVERVRRSWLFDFSHEFSIVVALPAEAVIDIIAGEIAESGASKQKDFNRKWTAAPYTGDVWDSGFTFSETALFKTFPTLVADGRLEMVRSGTRILVRSRVRQVQLAYQKLRLLSIALFLPLCLLTLVWSTATGDIAPDTIPIAYVWVCLTMGGLAFTIYFYRQRREVFLNKAARAEQWLRELFAPYIQTAVTE